MGIQSDTSFSLRKIINDKHVRGVASSRDAVVGWIGVVLASRQYPGQFGQSGQSLVSTFFKQLLVFKLARRLVLGCLITKLGNQHIGKFIL